MIPTIINRAYILLLLFVAGTSVPACGTESSTDETEQQSSVFPIFRPDGGEIMTEEWDGSTGFITLRYENNQYETVVEFYDGYATGSGWNRSEIGQGEIPTINYMNLMAGLNISVDSPDDQIPDAFIVTLTVS